MHSAFNLLILPNSMFTSLSLLSFFMKGLCALRSNSNKHNNKHKQAKRSACLSRMCTEIRIIVLRSELVSSTL